MVGCLGDGGLAMRDRLIQTDLRMAVAWLLLLVMAMPAGAEERVFKNIDVVVTPAIMEAVCDRLALSPQQRVAAMALHEEYLQETAAFDSELDRRLDAAGRAEYFALYEELAPILKQKPSKERVHAPPVPPDDPRWKDLERINARWQPVSATGQYEAESLLTQWIRRLVQTLGFDAELQDGIHRLIRRLNLEPQRIMPPDGLTNQVDVDVLIDAAMQPGGELHCVASSAETPECERMATRLDAIRNEFELQLDVWFQKELARRRSLQTHQPTVIRDTDPEWEANERSLTQAWWERLKPAVDASSDVERLAGDCLGPEAARRWRHRFLAAVAPQIAQARWPDSIVEWADRNVEPGSPVHAAVAALHAEYSSSIEELRRQALEAGIKVHRDMVIPRGTDTSHLEYMRRLVRIHQAGRDVINGLLPLLTPDQQIALTRELADGDRIHPVNLGPPIDRDALTALGQEPFFADPWLLATPKPDSKRKDS